jgi:aspartyl-tRNA(Asn)/glutamyl-tRNA(Gln) amidotransferase subunit A
MTDFSSIKPQIQEGKLSVEAIVSDFLKTIEEGNSKINAFLEVFDTEALEQAKTIDAKIAGGNAGPLAGLVISIKDNICYKGHKVSASSKMLDGFESLYTATALQKLLDQDAIVIGRVNCDEFAMGSSNENSAFGSVKNPINNDYVPGGSSGGSVASVAAKMCHASLGSDTGGSIRQPASYTNLVAVKPTYGLVSRFGLIAFASSFDQIGPICHSVADATLILNAITGIDENDGTSIEKRENIQLSNSNGKKRIAVIKEAINHPGLSSAVKSGFDKKIADLKKDGHTVEEISLPLLDYLVPTYYILTTAEASSNLARYDGVHFGYRSPNAESIEETYVMSRSEGFGPEVKRRILLGTFVLSSGFYDAYYSKAQKVRRLITNQTIEALSEYDFIFGPTTASAPFKIGEKAADPIQLYLEDIFTVQANLTGIPAVSIPGGHNAEGLPFGFQLMAANHKESELLSFADQISA